MNIEIIMNITLNYEYRKKKEEEGKQTTQNAITQLYLQIVVIIIIKNTN